MSHSSTRPAKNALEWTVFGLSCLLILAAAGALIWGSLQQQEEPVRLQVTTATPRREAGRVTVPVTVKNSGDGVAARVEIVVSGRRGGTIRQASFTLEFVPRHATRHGVVSFHGSEMPRELKAEVIGYEEH